MNTEEIGYFFNLGDSHKPPGSIGTKGHGTKVYYKSEGITIETHKNGQTIKAETEVPPWESLKKGIIPTYRYTIRPNTSGARGTTIRVTGFDAKHSEFDNLNEVTRYIRWSTIGGSLQRAMLGSGRPMQISLRLPDMVARVTLNCDFELPEEQSDTTNGTSNIVKKFPTVHLDAGTTSDGTQVAVDLHVLLLGDAARGFIPDTYRETGLWLCKDFVMIERDNSIWEEATGGQYYYRSFLAFANCQQFDLTANRNDVRQDEAHQLAIASITAQLQTVWNDQFVQNFFRMKSDEENSSKRSKAISEMDKRLQDFDG